MVITIGSTDRFLGEKLAQLAREVGHRPVSSANIDRVTTELKKPGSIVLLDMGWEAVQAAGILKRLVNVGRITGSRVICICPNTEEPLKKLAKSSGCAAWFLRYDLETQVRAFLRDLSTVKRAS